MLLSVDALMLSMKSTDGSLSTASVGDKGVHPAPSSASVWWDQFTRTLLPGGNSGEIFDALDKAIQQFSVDGCRADPFFLKIWLAYLEAHFSIYEDGDECRRLFKYLKSEHVGGPALADLYMHWAKFELSQGKPEKASGVLQMASEASSLQRNAQVLSAVQVLKITGKLNVASVLALPAVGGKAAVGGEHAKGESAVGGEHAKGASAVGVEHVKGESALEEDPLHSHMHSHMHPHVHLQKHSQLHLQLQTEARRESMASVTSLAVPRVSPAEEPSSAVQSTTSRLRRLGLGPPKRAVVTPLSPIDDSTVPKHLMLAAAPPNDTAVSIPTPPRQTTRHQAVSHDPSPLSAISRTRLNYTGSPLTSAIGADDDEEEDDSSLGKENTAVTSNRLAAAAVEKVKVVEEAAPAKTRAVRINGRTYRVLHLIGKGGSSKVFKVLAPDNQVLALKKVSLKNLDEATLSGYVNEIELLRSLGNEENIIRLIDAEFNREHATLYIVMEYGEVDLCQLLRSRTEKPEIDYNFTRYCWQQMLQAVKIVHAAKVVHCDLKPANFLMVKGNLKLIDFGISKAIMNDTTNIVRENQVGTVNYMSPEALQESASSARGIIKIGRPSDVWSLGCILYEMVYKKPPFAGFSLIQRLQKIMDVGYQIEFPPLDNAALLDAIKGCLSRSIKHRLTLGQLLAHPFLMPHLAQPVTSGIPVEHVERLLSSTSSPEARAALSKLLRRNS